MVCSVWGEFVECGKKKTKEPGKHMLKEQRSE